jgi:hypothetical protein
MTEPFISIKRSHDPSAGPWLWRCSNTNCGHVGLQLTSHASAVAEVDRHLREKVLDHHGTDDIYPYGGDCDEGRDYSITCWCGYEMTGETDGAVEASLDWHIELVQEDTNA